MHCPFCSADCQDQATVCTQCSASLLPLEAYRRFAAHEVFVNERPVAHIGDRALAQFFDLALSFVLFLWLGMAVGARSGGLTATGFSLSGGAALLVITAVVIVSFLYFWLLEGQWGTTLGKTMAGMQTRSDDGAPLGFRRSAVRNGLRLLDFIVLYALGFLVALTNRRRKRIGDFAAHSVVVQHSYARWQQGLAIGFWLVLTIVGLQSARSIFRAAAPQSSQEIAGAGEQSTAELPAGSEGASPPAATPTPAPVAAGTLSISSLEFLETREGVQRHPLPYKRGETVYTRYKVRGFQRTADQMIDLVLQAKVLDPSGLPLIDPWRNDFNQKVEPDTDVVNASFNVQLPVFVPQGRYSLVVEAQDRLSGQETRQPEFFEVDAPAIAPADNLEIRDFSLGTVKGESTAAVPPLTPPGELYHAFKMFGLEAKDDRIVCHVELKVVGPDGSDVMDNQEWVKVNERFVYHPPGFYLPVNGNFSIPEDAPTGMYSIFFKLVDDNSGKSVEQQAQFEVVARAVQQ